MNEKLELNQFLTIELLSEISLRLQRFFIDEDFDLRSQILKSHMNMRNFLYILSPGH